MIVIATRMVKKGTPTTSNAIGPAMESPKTMPGKKKNIPTRYKMANQRYLAVSLPRNLAIGIGNRMNGMG